MNRQQKKPRAGFLAGWAMYCLVAAALLYGLPLLGADRPFNVLITMIWSVAGVFVLFKIAAR